MTHIDEIVRQTGSHYFSLQHTVLIPHTSSLQSLRESAKSYQVYKIQAIYGYDISPISKMYFQPGRQLAEYMRDEMSAEQTVYKTFEFTQNVPNQNLSSSRLSGKIFLYIFFKCILYALSHFYFSSRQFK